MLQLNSKLLAYSLTTAEITYHLPDYPGLLQNFIWQNFDVAPDFPQLKRFLNFWQGNLDGKVHSVVVSAASLIRPAELRFANGAFSLN
ncbi:MAG: Usg family protein [Hyphomicrobiales bacterium]|nr:Usg family protein [Hyphomicrobiales bacterium]